MRIVQRKRRSRGLDFSLSSIVGDGSRNSKLDKPMYIYRERERDREGEKKKKKEKGTYGVSSHPRTVHSKDIALALRCENGVERCSSDIVRFNRSPATGVGNFPRELRAD